MINGKRVAVVLPAYNAEKTLEATVRELPDLVDVCILVDDHSYDQTVEVARRLGLRYFVHDRNYGYGRNQQTCYREALAAGADVVIMVHPDYQYTPLLVTSMASMIAYGVYDVVLGSRIIGGSALRGGMPLYKYVANRLLTAFENLFLGVKLSEYHTGYRAFSRDVLMSCRCWKTPTTSSSTTRCWRSACISAFASAKFPARRSTSRKLRPSTSGAACSMDSACWRPRCSSRCNDGVCEIPDFQRKWPPPRAPVLSNGRRRQPGSLMKKPVPHAGKIRPARSRNPASAYPYCNAGAGPSGFARR